MTTARTLLAGAAAALLALTAPAASDRSEFVEVAMTVEFGGDSISPVVLLEAGKTADIQFMYDPDYGKAEDPKRMDERAPAELDPRQSHRLLLTVDSAGDNGYIAKTEYMNLPEDKWTSRTLHREVLQRLLLGFAGLPRSLVLRGPSRRNNPLVTGCPVADTQARFSAEKKPGTVWR